MTPDDEDFEKFVGAEKAKEIKQLFSSWIHKIYRKLSSLVRRCWYLLVHRASSIRLGPLQQRFIRCTPRT